MIMETTSKTNFVKQYKPGSKARVALVNGRILDVINGHYFDAGTSVILKDGVVESLPNIGGESRFPVDYTIDLKGKTVLPGLFNTHCHLLTVDTTMCPDLSDIFRPKKYLEQQLIKNLSDCLVHGITHVRDAWQPDLRKSRNLKERISKREINGPRIQQSVVVGPTGSYMQEKLPLMTKVFGGVAQVKPLEDYAGSVAFPIDATEAQVRTAVDIAIDERGADVIKIGDEPFSFLARMAVPVMTIEQLSVVADQARCRGVQSTMHHSSIESFRRGIKAGVSSMAHLPMDAQLTQSDIDAFGNSGCIDDPTLSAFYPILSWRMESGGANDDPELIRMTAFRDNVYTFADIADEYFIPELRASVMNGYRQCASGKPKLMGIMDASEFYKWSEKTANIFENFRLLYEQGVPMTTANDNKSPITPAMMDLELLMFDHLLKGKPDGKQLTGAEAVKIATINSARSLGLEDEFGSIESGKTADLVILDGDPLEDFRLIGSRVEALFMDGELVINNCNLQVETNGKA
jgi:imidazolonepropionase-like amidohydrolase